MTKGIKQPVEERFWQYVLIGDDCWNWTGTKNDKGYGNIRCQSRRRLVHRLSWEIHRGPIPAGICVLHRCDNPSCIRPGHLFLGTHHDNMQDCLTKGRFKPANLEDNGMAKLTVSLVKEIRASGEPAPALAARMGVSPSAIKAARTRRSWRTVP